jgi:hypothetical protein
MGSNPARVTAAGSRITWEILRPAAEFGQMGNVFITLTTDDPSERAAGAAAVATFRWASGYQASPGCSRKP